MRATQSDCPCFLIHATQISVKCICWCIQRQQPAFTRCQRRYFVTEHCLGEGHWQSVCWSAWYLLGSTTIADRVASFYEQSLFIWKSTAFTRGALDRGTHGLSLAFNWWTAALNKTRGYTKHHLVDARTLSGIRDFSGTGMVVYWNPGTTFYQPLRMSQLCYKVKCWKPNVIRTQTGFRALFSNSYMSTNPRLVFSIFVNNFKKSNFNSNLTICSSFYLLWI